MFDLGIQELVLIFVVALLVFGPKKLPELARTMGKTFGQLRRAMFDIKAEVEREMKEDTGQIKHDLPNWKQEYPLNKAPEGGETQGVEDLNKEGDENISAPDAKKDSAAEPAEEPESNEQPNAPPVEETRET